MILTNKQIRELIKCPQFGDHTYGKWGSLPFEVRKTLYDLIMENESMDRIIKEHLKTKTYKLFIRKYDITKNDYIVKEEIIKTNDLYHEIGKIYSTSIEHIKRIDYQEVEK